MRGKYDAYAGHIFAGMTSTETETLRAFYVEFRQQLYTYAVSITGNRESAEDAIHGVFQQLLRRDEMPAELRPYVFRGVRNAAFDTLRRTRVRDASIFDATGATEASSAVAPTIGGPHELEHWLDLLSPDERETIVLKIYDELTFQQIADLRQVPLQTVASWYRRGLSKMKTTLTTKTL
jgi:RNA polymerase sigma-70 factor (ECF subfamily)